MRTRRDLLNHLESLERRPYPAYKDIRGQYQDTSGLVLRIDYVQGDPFAAPSRIALRVPRTLLALPAAEPTSRARRIAYQHAYLRHLSHVLCRFGTSRGSGKSGRWSILQPAQAMLDQTAVILDEHGLEVRLSVGLPARGRRIAGLEAADMFDQELGELFRRGIRDVPPGVLEAHADLAEDQEALRRHLHTQGWLAFVRDGSMLARESGVSDLPMQDGVPWAGPKAYHVVVDLPHAGRISGTAFQPGVTLICGGGYHGKSTLLSALARGVYNHQPGDGREYCATDSNAVSVRAEDGRRVCGVNISGFINNLPGDRDVTRFTSENASGSTSQAANIAEALEVGATALLIDEDTSATNFMVRDRRMQALIATEDEPITPFVDRVRTLYDHHGVSSVLVVGGAGDYFEVADYVLVMRNYTPNDATERAAEIAIKWPSGRLLEERSDFVSFSPRTPAPDSLDPSRGRRKERVRAHSTRSLSFGEEDVDVSFVSQLIAEGQVKTIGDWLLRLSRSPKNHTLHHHCDLWEHASQKLASATESTFGDRVEVRRFELAAALNRLRVLRVEYTRT